MSTEILLYVAIGIIWLVLQALGRKKKPQQQPAQPQRPPVTLQDVLGKMEWVPNNEPPAPPAVQPVDLMPAPRPRPSAPAAEPVPPGRKPKVAVKKPDRTPLAEQLRNPQTAQSAVIAAEVLGKPRAYRKAQVRRL